MPISVVARSKTWVYGRSLGGIVGSNPAEGMDVCVEYCVMSGRGLCDGLITRPEKSYRLWCVVVCDLETSRMRRPWPTLGRSATEKKKILHINSQKSVSLKLSSVLPLCRVRFAYFCSTRFLKNFTAISQRRMLTQYAAPVQEIHRASAPKCLTLCKYSSGRIFSKLLFSTSTQNNTWAGIAQSV